MDVPSASSMQSPLPVAEHVPSQTWQHVPTRSIHHLCLQCPSLTHMSRACLAK
jgi:hypothetical protein